MTTKRTPAKPKPKRCKDCVAEGITTDRPAPYVGPRCKTHHHARRRVKRATNADRLLMIRFGITRADYDAIYAAQGGRCYGCRRATGASRALSVDHDHRTGAVRGLLCRPCNDLLGHIRDDPAMLQRFVDYLTPGPAGTATEGWTFAERFVGRRLIVPDHEGIPA